MNLIKKIVSFTFPRSRSLSEVLEATPKEECYFEDLKLKLKNTTIKITERRTDCFFVKFIEKKSEYLLCFAQDGKFLFMEYEYWKDMNVKFNTKKLIKL